MMNHDDDQKKKERINKVIAKHENMARTRTNWESHWQECMDYIVPSKNDVTVQRTQGDKRGAELFDTTAIMSNELLAGALHGMLTNPSVRFFDLVMDDPEVGELDTVKRWLQETGERMFQVLNNTNFQTEIHEIYIDLGAIGTACLYMGEHEENVVHFGARPIKEIFISENNLGLIDTVHREFKWKPRQIIQEFGEKNIHPWIKEQHEKGCDDDWTIIHAVCPCEPGDPSMFKYRSEYILKDKKYCISEGGFKEFPYAVPRWTKTSGEIYGRGPGMKMLPDIKMLNKMMETTLKGAQKTVDPPMAVTDDGVIGKVRLTPGGLSVVRPGEMPIRPLITDARIDFGYQAIADIRSQVRAGFYGNLFQLREGPQMTATEVNTISEQQMRLMGPVLGRQHFELLSPLIIRLYGLMLRRGQIETPPEEMQGKSFEVRYSSLIARAQRMGDVSNFNRAISIAAPLIQIDQAVTDNIDTDASLKYIYDLCGAPHRLLRKKRDVEERRQARAKAQEQVIQQEREAHAADVASKTMPGAAQVMMAEKG